MTTKTDEQRATEWEARIDITDPIREICERLGLNHTYVARLNIVPGDTQVELYKGKDGRCQGAKYIDDTGDAAMETLDFKTPLVSTWTTKAH